MEHGPFCELYTDRGSHNFHKPEAGEPASKSVQTQVGRALAQLGIRHIAAYSPEARGLLSLSKGGARVPHLAEPAPAKAGDRLPKELALAGMTTIAGANRWLAETYWPAHNAAFAVAPAETGSAFVADRTGRVRDILCIQEERPVGNDNTVKWRGLTLQIPPRPLRPHFVRAPWCACTNTPTGAWRPFTGRIDWPITIPERKLCDNTKLAA